MFSRIFANAFITGLVLITICLTISWPIDYSWSIVVERASAILPHWWKALLIGSIALITAILSNPNKNDLIDQTMALIGVFSFTHPAMLFSVGIYEANTFPFAIGMIMHFSVILMALSLSGWIGSTLLTMFGSDRSENEKTTSA